MRLRYKFSRSVVSDSLWPHGLQHARIPCPSPTPGACLNSCPSSWWRHPTIPFSSCLQSFPASGSFPMSQLFTSGSQSIGALSSASVLSVNIQDWFPLGLRFDLLAVQGTLKSLPQNHNSKALVLGLLCGPTLTSVHDYWKNHSFDYPYFTNQKMQETDILDFQIKYWI